MKCKYILPFAVLSVLGCWEESNWEERLDGTGTANSFDTNLSCSETQYDEWESSEYSLPYPTGTSYTVGLSHCGGSYHSEGLPDQFAIDFNMSIGTRITAARAGVVVHVEESGIDGSFPNNLVIVEHSDGTYGMYMHLTNNGASVSIGGRVGVGSTIGYSGNTGLAGYPHLHFVVTAPGNYSYPYRSIPVNFNNTTPNPRSLESGVEYIAN